eukprot:ctg_1111.g341
MTPMRAYNERTGTSGVQRSMAHQRVTCIPSRNGPAFVIPVVQRRWTTGRSVSGERYAGHIRGGREFERVGGVGRGDRHPRDGPLYRGAIPRHTGEGVFRRIRAATLQFQAARRLDAVFAAAAAVRRVRGVPGGGTGGCGDRQTRAPHRPGPVGEPPGAGSVAGG